MSVVESDIQWFIAREGKQHGPLSEPEMRKLVELNHLRASDLIWRLGFPDWRPAHSVFPPTSAAEPAQAPGPQTMPRPEESLRRPVSPTPTSPSPNPYTQPAPSYAAPQHEMRPDQQPSRPLGTPYRGGGPGEPVMTAGPRPGPSGARPQQYAAPVSEPDEPRRRGGARRVFVMLLLLGLIGGGGWYGYKHKDLVMAVVRATTGSPSKPVPVVAAPDGATKVPGSETQSATMATAVVAPAATSSITPEFLKRPLWATVKQDFPEWYDARVAEVSHLSSEGKPEDEIMRHLVQSLVTLRRENSQAALAASTATHRELATAFLNNLKQLSQESGEGCYDFISKGETSPFIIARMGDAEKSAAVDHQVITILSAISEGKKTPVTHAAPVKADYDVLAGELTRLGWTQQDMQLFANPKALAQAPRDRVCKMLQDWFSAHLSITDPAVQERLLFETLKPVVSG